MRKATLADVRRLVLMMEQFYAESPYKLNAQRAAVAFRLLLADERLGHVWFVQADSTDVGYVVLTVCHSMTYGGPTAIVDDFFVTSSCAPKPCTTGASCDDGVSGPIALCTDGVCTFKL